MKTHLDLNVPLDATGEQGHEVEEGDQVQEDGFVHEEQRHAAHPLEHAVQDEQGYATHNFDMNEQAEDEDYHDESGIYIGNQTFSCN
uniref:Uncharacterized protein n=1 Tax=Setaria italica TaxID=4555 RepID=K3ZB96_SETIT